jgi:flagellar export protein FliJ
VSAQRLRRASRIVDIRERAVRAVEVKLYPLCRRTADASEALAAARALVQATLSAPSTSSFSSADLADTHAYLLGLERRVAVLVVEERKARLEEEALRRKVIAAKAELKKVEVWRDRLAETLRADEQLQERKATDTVAARIPRGA